MVFPYLLLLLVISQTPLTVRTSPQLIDEELPKGSLNLLLEANTLILHHLPNRTDNNILMYSSSNNSNSKISLFDNVKKLPFI